MWEVIREFKFAEIAPSWAKSHVQVPTPLIFDNRVIIYYASRDGLGKSQLLSFSIDVDDPTTIVSKDYHPLISLGDPGTFDEDGVMVSSVIEVDSTLLLYYTGWQRSFTVPYITSVGLLIKEKKESSFAKFSKGPIFGRNSSEPYFVNTPFVYRDKDEFRMIYGSGKKWTLIADRFEPTYFLKRSQSSNALNWSVSGEEFMEPVSGEESTVRATRYVSSGGELRIMFSSRQVRDFRGGSGSYSLFEIPDCPANQGLPSRTSVEFANPELVRNQNMLAYPSIFNLGSNYLLFNGSDFGKQTIFLAREVI